MTLQSQIRAAEREERLRRAYYPKRIERGQMTEEMAAHEIEAMASIVCTLKSLLPPSSPNPLYNHKRDL